ncbi:non-homologous end joining protein Ku [Pseudochryseolinea flava]|uniref:Non-homologous end joining protein Ku n=1 Tax=Pseudochryseolinea flava TaxID=2059302 RepID=A0A364XXN5_9BACT|nr:Ku protein [Pseudochryseolinea flava]RAV99170.1 Ku protein [Pseudochryseolinea flava]
MKAIWKGAIGFGLVNIPVKLYSASQRSELDLDMLDKKDHAHIRFRRVNEKTGREVNYKDIVKGYKYRNQYIILEDKDFKAASPKKSSIIDISDFVMQEEIEPMFFESPYYLVPEKSGNKAYTLLLEALQKSEKAGIGSFVLRNKEHLCVLSPMKNVIVLNTIRYAEEIRDTTELDLPKHTKPKPNELKMAMSLIDQLSTSFKPNRFKDTYSSDLMKMIKSKANTKGKKKKVDDDSATMKVTHRKKKDDDIMAQLKASLKKAS